MKWFNSLSPHAQAALIVAIVTLVGIVVKDVVIALWRERKKSEKEILALLRGTVVDLFNTQPKICAL